jgi:hypothetical protein
MTISRAKQTACIQLFQELECCPDELTERFQNCCTSSFPASVDAIVPKLHQNKMMAHILDCLEALRVVSVENQRIVDENHEKAKKNSLSEENVGDTAGSGKG